MEIWDKKHALKICDIFNEVFGDMEEYTSTSDNSRELDFSFSDDDDDDDDNI